MKLIKSQNTKINLKKIKMFEKKKKIEMPFDEDALELLSADKIKYATKIYIKSYNMLFNINSLGVVSEIEGGALVKTYNALELVELFKEKKIKFYRIKLCL